MKTYLIIGGSSGIGQATVQQLAEAGHRVYATYLSNPVTTTQNNVTYHELDVLADDLSLDFIEENLDGIAFCPGQINLKPFKAIKPKTFAEDYNLQVLGFIKVLQASLKKLNEGASIVAYSTVAVQSGFNFHSIVAASKGAIEGLVTSLAAEFAPKFRVNAIAPSLVNTPMAGTLLNSEEKIKANGDRHPLKRVGQPEDIAKMTTFLLSEDSSWMTGQVLHVDGGKSTINL
jgi:NAD(P)-dependent dehydrogenase (short-subunit alcohol dehydrogenase family)